MRADVFLVEGGHAATRSQAQRLIAAGVQWRLAASLPWSDEVRAGASLLAGQGGAPSVLLLRVLARRMEAARAVLHEGWRLLRPALLDMPARPPRLWAT